jgi:hypothetical protein
LFNKIRKGDSSVSPQRRGLKQGIAMPSWMKRAFEIKARSYYNMSTSNNSLITLLQGIPDVVFATLLSSWVTAADVARLDSAWCSTKDRSVFLRTAYGATTVLCYPVTKGYVNMELLSLWMLLKGAAMARFAVTQSVIDNEQLCETFLKSRGTQLRDVSFYMRQSYDTGAAVDAIALCVGKYCPNLTTLQGANFLTDVILRKIAEGCPLLETFLLEGRSCSNEALKALAQHCHQLRYVSIRTDTEVPLDGLLQLVGSCAQLTTLQIISHRYNLGMNHPRHLTESLLLQLAANCPEIAKIELNFANLSESGFHALVEHCPKLHSLTITYSNLAAATPARTLEFSFHALEVLTIRSVSLDDGSLDGLLRCCPALTTLELVELDGLSYRGLCKLGTHAPRLEVLHMDSNDDATTDEVLLNVAAHCSALRVFKVPRCEDLSDEGVCAVIQACPHLEDIDLEGIESLTDAVLFALGAHSQQLRTLRVDGWEMTREGVTALLAGCPLLTEVKLPVSSDVREMVDVRYAKEVRLWTEY